MEEHKYACYMHTPTLCGHSGKSLDCVIELGEAGELDQLAGSLEQMMLVTYGMIHIIWCGV